MESKSANPGARVGGFPSPAKTNGKAILQPWRQGLRIPKSCKKPMGSKSYNPGARVCGFPNPAKQMKKQSYNPDARV